MAYTSLTKFHGYLDTKARGYQVYKPGQGWTTTTVEKHITIQERAPSYRFFPHFHPYVAELVRRLVGGSIRGLQATDTQYRKNDDGTLVTLGTLATLPDGTRVTLPDGTQVTLPDGAQVPLPDGTSADLPSGAVLSLFGGRGFFEVGIILGAGFMVIIPDGARKTFTNNTQVMLPDGSTATIPSGTPVALRMGGKPRPVLYEEIFSLARYNPSELVQLPYPAKDLDFTPSAAYGVYNWELFFHVPIIIATHLSKNQRFEEAMRWFHYIFDPTDDSDGPTPERFWKVKPFQYTDVKLIENILVNLSTGADPVLRQETINSINVWKDSPFRPHVVARYRQSAYMFKEEIERFLNEEGTEKTGKKTNKALYAWMKREVKGLYGQCFQFAFDIAKKAERTLQHELGNSELGYLQFGYLAGKEGLLAGEKLYLDIKRMEMAYHDLNQREYELIKHVSLLQVNPLALLQLRTTGRCTVFLPEELFDMDGPGHYFRRIKSVAVSIPCVIGPYTGVNCTLTLLKSAIRKNPLLRDGNYARDGAEDDRFSDHFGSLQAIVTSTGQNDSGLFETNLRDERYLPFEGSGVVSEWQFELPANPSKNDPRQFDYDTIADVIIHLRYTAREGGGLLRNGAVGNLTSRIEEAQAAGSVRLFSVRHEFPSEWAKFKSVKIEDATKVAELTLNLREEHYPFWSRSRLEAVKRADFFAKTAKTSVEVADKADGTGNKDTKDASMGDLRIGKLTNISLPAPTGKFTLYFNDNSMEELWLALAWGKGD